MLASSFLYLEEHPNLTGLSAKSPLAPVAGKCFSALRQEQAHMHLVPWFVACVLDDAKDAWHSSTGPCS